MARPAWVEELSRASAKGHAVAAVEQVIDDRTVAVLIDSSVLGTSIWFAFDDDFKSGDDLPVFFASELPFLREMTTEELRRRYAEKKALSGGWIRDRIEH
jgi:hypothetical protein